MFVDFQDFVDVTPKKNGLPLGCPDDLRMIQRVLRDRYLEPQRHYHTLAHIQYGYIKYFEFFDAIDPITFFAWAYHDAVYDPTRDDNEARSAMLFEEDNRVLRFGVNESDEIISKILSTDHTSVTNLVTDMDLAGLGSSVENYEENTRLIRTEYSFADDEMWKQGRSAFLKSFIQRAIDGNLYHTREFAAAYTHQAIFNMSLELARLDGVDVL